MSDNTKHYLLWIDVETTAIKPEDGQLLEVGMRITNLDGSDVAPQAVDDPYVFSTIVPHKQLTYTNKTEYAFIMHQNNGLINEVLNCDEQRSIIPWLVDCIDKLQDNNWQHAVLHPAGTNVDFDLEWLKAHQIYLYPPIFDSNVSYRKLDMSAIRLTLMAIGIDQYKANHKTTHRVDDCLDRDIHDWKNWVQWVREHDKNDISSDCDCGCVCPQSLYELFESEDDE